MGAKKDSRPITKKTHVAKIPWIPKGVANALVANNVPTLGALRKALSMAKPRGMLLELIKRNLFNIGDLEPLLAKVNAAPSSDRRPQAQL
ncbi:MAG TPA: hypothetical protein VN397_02475 [Candidatus Methylomirabilis sp.]|nr:hypothetical protein [Candidatus Methylomirabilis sp.]